MFEETNPAYVTFNLLVSAFCTLSGYMYAYMAAFRSEEVSGFDMLEKEALLLELVFVTHFILQFFKG